MNGEENELLQLVTTTYGPLLSQKQLAELLKRSHQGLRYSLGKGPTPRWRAATPGGRCGKEP